MVTLEEKRDFIREKCIEVNPKGRSQMSDADKIWDDVVRIVTIADVFIAIIGGVLVDTSRFRPGNGGMKVPEIGAETLVFLWNLKDDNLDKQDEKTIDYIYQILDPYGFLASPNSDSIT